MSKIVEFLNSIEMENEIEGLEEVESNIRMVSLAKGQQWQKQGEAAGDIAVVREGALRIYYLLPDGQEYNQAFKFEGEEVAAFASLITGEPCAFYIEALEDTELEVLSYRVVEELFRQHSIWERLGRKLAERHFVVKEQREAEFLLLVAKERYEQLLTARPDILERIPRYHIASYLGIKPQSLARLAKSSTK